MYEKKEAFNNLKYYKEYKIKNIHLKLNYIRLMAQIKRKR